MAESKNYVEQEQENGKILISEDVIASVTALAVREVKGVYGLSLSASLDISKILNKTNFHKGIRVNIAEEGVSIACNLVVRSGEPVMTVAKAVQENIANAVFSMAGIRPIRVDVNVCGVAIPKTPKK
ncbi:MAG: Asp23/Gls24 family envelope stress response protein [Oscillospiraceae bacterium]|nr:Asp23/Gls24 family envelope stress response protein [Oscillospiraceae bacterium]